MGNEVCVFRIRAYFTALRTDLLFLRRDIEEHDKLANEDKERKAKAESATNAN